MASYSILSLPSPGKGRLTRAASSVFNPLSKQVASPVPAPTYSDLVAKQHATDIAPEFAATGATALAPSMFLTDPGTGAPAPTVGITAATNPVLQPFKGPSVSGPVSYGGFELDYGSDPILQQVQAQVQSQDEAAQAAALGQEKTAGIRYGSGDLIAQILGEKADQATIDAANNNTFGTVQELGRWNDRALSGIDSAANRNNLYFSSTRARDRGLQQEDYGRNSAKTANQFQDVITGISQGLLDKRSGLQAQLLAAMDAAFARALQMAMFAASAAGGGGGGPALPTDTSAEIPPSAYTYQTDPQKTIQWWLNNPNPFWRPGGYVRSGAVNSGRVGFG